MSPGVTKKQVKTGDWRQVVTPLDAEDFVAFHELGNGMNCSKDFSLDAVSQRNVQILTFCEAGPFGQDDNAAKNLPSYPKQGGTCTNR